MRGRMDFREREELEQEIRQRCDACDLAGAATVALRGYGPQIFGLLMALHRDEQDAGEIFSIFMEDLWAGLPRFAWECSFRTWAYTLARNASYRFKKGAGRRAAQGIPFSACSSLSGIEQQVRSETMPYLRTAPKNRLAELRESLPREDQLLLILRIDRRMAWNDLARVMLGDDEQATEGALKKEAARLRKRFQLVKEKIFELGRREGLFMGTPEDG